MTRQHLFRALAFAALVTLAPAGAAQTTANVPGVSQVKNLLGNLLGNAASSPAAAPAKPAAGTPGSALTLQANAAALNELRVDTRCEQVQERSDVWEKAAEYGGTQAQMRLRTLIASDFAHSDLTESDHRLLRYLAYTTVWVPASVESAVGKTWVALTSSGDEAKMETTGRSQRRAAERLGSRLNELRGTIEGFPGSVSLVLDTSLRDGAFARVGGLVVVSPRFLSLMDETDSVRDVVLTHELSHIYKRHTIKELQYRLITSAGGWTIAKKLLGRFDPGSALGLSGLTSVFTTAQAASQLLEFVRSTQASYSKDQELEADACALGWLARIDIEPRAAWQAFSGVLTFSARKQEGDASYEDSHPSPTERTANIQDALARNKPPPPKPPIKTKG
jgi:Peptidase family M48